MPGQNQNAPFVQNSFVGGLKTEFTGLNFPENACTQVDNFVFTITGDCTRRGGFDFEQNFQNKGFSLDEVAFVTYKWNNAGGLGANEMVVTQIGGILYFYHSSNATQLNPLSAQLDTQTINLANFQAQNNKFSPSIECQFCDGNGVLFVFNPTCDPFYVTLTNSGAVSGTVINVQIRDFQGVPEPGVSDTFRPPSAQLTPEHLYNLYNQGWTQFQWNGTVGAGYNVAVGPQTFTLTSASNTAPSPTIVGGIVEIAGNCTNGSQFGGYGMSGTITAFTYPSITVTINEFTTGLPGFVTTGTSNVQLQSVGNINAFENALSVAPSNSDVWWEFRNSSGVFSPSTVAANITLDDAPAPKGHFIINAFNQAKQAVSGVGVTSIVTDNRPVTGAFFQDRIWYAGVVGAQDPTGDAPFYSWTELIYFSQAINAQVQGQGSVQFGQCYQTEDPTSSSLFDLLPTDGGVITIEGCGPVYKLFAVTNGLLVFAANGIWFITGSGGLGFAANDYTVAKIGNIRSISGTSFINVLGYPVFWNAEGIWSVTPNQNAVPYGHGGLNAENLCLGTILSYYNNIPLISKKYARGDFDPVNYTIQWVFRSTNETDITSRYSYDSLLALNTINRAFYPYTFPSPNVSVNGLIYVASPGGSVAPQPVFKYPVTSETSTGADLFTFAEERDFTNYVDFISLDGVGTNYLSSFLAGYNLHGGAIARWNPEFIYVFLRGGTNSYLVNGVWDYAVNPSSGRYSNAELVNDVSPLYGMVVKRHRVRGRGLVFQLQIQSVQGLPCDIMGWSIYEHKAAGP